MGQEASALSIWQSSCPKLSQWHCCYLQPLEHPIGFAAPHMMASPQQTLLCAVARTT